MPGYNKLKQRLKKFTRYRHFGRIHIASKQYDLGIAKFDQAIALAQEGNDRNAEAEHMGTKGLSLLEADKPGEACACSSRF